MESSVENEDFREYCVYFVTNLINGKIYCGQTCVGLSKRWGRHLNDAKSGVRRRFCAAVRKHGEQAFKVEEVEKGLTKEQANAAEKFWIKELNLTDRYAGYNMTEGGESGSLFKVSLRPDLDDGDLLSSYKDGESINQLADRFNASTCTIWKKLRKQGAEIRPASTPRREDLRDEEIKSMYLNGLSLPRIAKELNSASSSIRKRLQSMGVKRRSGICPRMKLDEVKATCMYLEGFTLKEIGKEVGAALSTVHKRLKQLGVIYAEEDLEYA